MTDIDTNTDVDVEDPGVVVVAMRVDDMPSMPVPGSKKVACDNCLETVWLSPGSQFAIERGIAPEEPIWCRQCVRAHMEESEDA